jgi:hypothetical protein
VASAFLEFNPRPSSLIGEPSLGFIVGSADGAFQSAPIITNGRAARLFPVLDRMTCCFNPRPSSLMGKSTGDAPQPPPYVMFQSAPIINDGNRPVLTP